jgi:dTDP-4-dehydrorhamnose reductase
MKPLLLLGKTGQLGQELARLLPNTFAVQALGRADIDFTQVQRLKQVVLDLQPQSIVNAAAYTAVDRAEKEPEQAFAMNQLVPMALAEVAKQLEIPLIHISTDYVFDGQHHRPYQETDQPHPIGLYGRSKLAGEEAIRQTWANHYIVRTAWLYGALGQGNFVKTMLRLGQSRAELGVVFDQIGSPTSTTYLAEGIIKLVQGLAIAAIDPSRSAGTYHLANSGVASWYDFAIAIFEEARARQFPLALQRVNPLTTAEYPTVAHRPAYSVLSSRKLETLLPLTPTHWRESLRSMLDQLMQEML